MPHVRTRLLLVVATVVSGVLAGGIVDRMIVGGPAWHELGSDTWVQYSRLADLGTGLVAYPIEGIGSALLIIAAAVSNYFDRNAPLAVSLPLYLAVALSIIGLLLTAKAAPIMLGLAEPQSAAAIQHAFEDFFFWGLYLRGLAEMLAFVVLVVALANFAWPKSELNRA
jgi:hypothetical protein